MFVIVERVKNLQFRITLITNNSVAFKWLKQDYVMLFFIHFAVQKGSEDPFVPTKVIKAKESKHSSLCHGHYHSCQRKVN